MSFHFRVSKYDPASRDRLGVFLGSEWTSIFDDIDLAVYKSIENQYVEFVLEVMDITGIRELEAIEIENNLDLTQYPAAVQNEIERLYRVFDSSTSKIFDKKELPEVIRLPLREAVWFKLRGKDSFYVHFGYDYYMYIGSETVELSRSRIRTQLFVEEDFLSPYSTREKSDD